MMNLGPGSISLTPDTQNHPSVVLDIFNFVARGECPYKLLLLVLVLPDTLNFPNVNSNDLSSFIPFIFSTLLFTHKGRRSSVKLQQLGRDLKRYQRQHLRIQQFCALQQHHHIWINWTIRNLERSVHNFDSPFDKNLHDHFMCRNCYQLPGEAWSSHHRCHYSVHNCVPCDCHRDFIRCRFHQVPILSSTATRIRHFDRVYHQGLYDHELRAHGN
jgi:hypothetical protein